MLSRDEEVGGDRHELPGHHERVRVIREQHQSHAREKHVVLQAEQAGRGTVAAGSRFTLPEVARAEERDAGGGYAEQHEEGARERIEAQMKRQIGQPDRQHQAFRRRVREARGGNRSKRHPNEGAKDEEGASCIPEAARPYDARGADGDPCHDERAADREWR